KFRHPPFSALFAHQSAQPLRQPESRAVPVHLLPRFHLKTMVFNQPSRRTAGRVLARTLALSGAAWAVAFALGGTSFIPISDAELSRRADVVVHGIVISSVVKADRLGRPETVSVIAPLSVLKGTLKGALIIHQLGGQLPDGRFFQMWGRPEYVPGSEVIVFAIARRG